MHAARLRELFLRSSRALRSAPPRCPTLERHTSCPAHPEDGKDLLQSRQRCQATLSPKAAQTAQYTRSSSRGSYTFIVGRDMTPRGCNCTVYRASRSRLPRGTKQAIKHSSISNVDNHAGSNCYDNSEARALVKKSDSVLAALRKDDSFGAGSAPSPHDRVAQRGGWVVEEQRHRVILPGMAPGSVIRTRGAYYRRILQTKQLPRSCAAMSSHDTLEGCMPEGGFMVSSSSGDSAPPAISAASSSTCASSSVPALPCVLAAEGQCRMCPWMSLGANLSAATKGSLVRRYMTPISDTSCRTGCASSSAVVVHYDETFAVSVQPHRLQEVTLKFELVKEEGAEAGALQQSHDEEGAETKSDLHEQEQQHEHSRQLRQLRQLMQCGTTITHASSRDSPARTVGRFVLHTTTSTATHSSQSCLLCTLEQKRLVGLLTRWVNDAVPSWAQRMMRWVHIIQPAHMARQASWQADLIVTVYMHKCSDRHTMANTRTCYPNRDRASHVISKDDASRTHTPGEMEQDEENVFALASHVHGYDGHGRDAVHDAWSYSPLSGSPSCVASSSSSWGGVLSVPEQALVEAVLGAAPLITHVHIHVAFDDGTHDSLYPAPVRRQSRLWESLAATVAHADASGANGNMRTDDEEKDCTRRVHNGGPHVGMHCRSASTRDADSSNAVRATHDTKSWQENMHTMVVSSVPGGQGGEFAPSSTNGMTTMVNSYPTRPHVCVCAALSARVCVRMPACHGVLWWLACVQHDSLLHAEYERQQRLRRRMHQRDSSRNGCMNSELHQRQKDIICRATMPMWRHEGALDAVCSVLTTRLLDPLDCTRADALAGRKTPRVWWYDAMQSHKATRATTRRSRRSSSGDGRYCYDDDDGALIASAGQWSATWVLQLLLHRCLIALSRQLGWGTVGFVRRKEEESDEAQDMNSVGVTCVSHEALEKAAYVTETREICAKQGCESRHHPHHVILAPVMCAAVDGPRLCNWLAHMAQSRIQSIQDHRARRQRRRSQVQQQQQRQGHAESEHDDADDTMIVRLVLCYCSDNMMLEPLQQTLEHIVQLQHQKQAVLPRDGGADESEGRRVCDTWRGWKVTDMHAGAIDVDVLSASMVAYCVVNMSHRGT